MWWPWSESIKKRACRYLLQRYLGNFLEEKLTLDQLSVDLYNGTGTVSEVSLDCDALNELGDSQNWPLQIVDGYMKEITIKIPWSTLFNDDSVVEVNGLFLAVQPKVRSEAVSSMLESMWSSMSSSMQLAEECLRDEEGPKDSSPVDGIEMFAHAIDSILSRVKVKFINTKVRIEHVPKNSDKGIALEIHIQKIDYFDEAGEEPTPEITDPDKPKTYIVASYTNKKIKFEGVTLYTDEFPAKLRTMARSLIMEKSMSSQPDKETEDINYQSTVSDVFYETRSVMSTIELDPVKEAISDTKPVDFREVTPEERASQPDPVLFAKLSGEQELALRLRRMDEAEGPKVEVQILLGSFMVFISPRQLHTLIELVDALNQPDLEDTSNIPLRPTGGNIQCKPMQPADFQLIEAQLINAFDRQTLRPPAAYGWSGPSLEESSDNERFHPMTSHNPPESMTSSVSSMTTSMTSSVNVPSQPRVRRNRKVPHIDGDPTAEVSHISFRVESMYCVLLHKDILVTAIGSDCITPASANKLQSVAQEFFDSLPHFDIGEKNDVFDDANQVFDKTTSRNHLRLLLSEVVVDGSEKLTSHGSQLVCEASIQHALVRESLYFQSGDNATLGPQSYDLVKFAPKEEDDDTKVSSRPNIKVSLKQTSKYMRVSGEKKLMYPTTDITIKCMPLQLDVELTILERMSSTFFGSTSSAGTSSVNNQLNLTVQCHDLNVLLRFPIADLRAGISRETRRVRPDHLSFRIQNASVSTHQTPAVRPTPTVVTLKTTALDLYYHECEGAPGTHIARSLMDDMTDANILKGHVFAPLPTISLTFKPQKPTKGPFDPLSEDEQPFLPANTNPMTTSIYIMNNLKSSSPSPFSGKKMAHQGVASHDTDGKGPVPEEELIQPGSAEEMAEFTTSSLENSAIHLDFNLPVLSLQLESKQLYEIIYNRINSDLLLWEPQLSDPFEINPLMTNTIYPAFGLCKGPGYDSDSESTSSEEENLYYSVHENKMKKSGQKPVVEKDTHNFCLTFKVGKGLLTIYAPVRDANKYVVPGQMGELVLDAQTLTMCVVTGLNGKPKSAQLCLRMAKCVMYHESLLTIPCEKPGLRLYGSVLPSHLKPVIYPSAKGVAVKDNLVKKDIFAMALKVEPSPETNNLKTICISLGIEQATYRYQGDKGIAWLTQLTDVIDVLDYPVPGYTPSIVLSELHVHLADCTVDYRPLYLPIRAVLTLGSFSISTNLIPETNTSCQHFLAQECILFLSHLHPTRPNLPIPQDDDKHPDIKKDYVCVIDIGVFELSLRMAEKNTSLDKLETPLVDVSASNNMVNLNTCWDSATALFKLVTYLATDGDSQPPMEPCSRHTSICSDQPIEQLVGLDDRPVEEIRELSPNEIQQVNDLMAEAMKESPSNTLDEEQLEKSMEKEGVEVFFFPDESNMNLKQPAEDLESDEEVTEDTIQFPSMIKSLIKNEDDLKAQIARDLGQSNSARRKRHANSSGNNTDDEYCMVEPQSTPDDDLEEPLVIWYGPVPRYNEDHFSVPTARTDVLAAPKDFPMPVLKYSIREMSISWNLYGGNDFYSPPETSPPKKSVTIDDSRKPGSPSTNRTKEYEPYEGQLSVATAYSRGVSWSKSAGVKPRPVRDVERDLKCRGGKGRDHKTIVSLKLSKVKFVYETYPPGVTQSSRQTLAISNIEILDKLQCSELNKLLSLYKLKDEPERTYAQMLVIKAVHLRQEPELLTPECCLKVSLLPLRFNLDQDTLAFLVGFFSKLGSDESSDDDTKSVVSTESGSRQHTPTHRPPVMGIASHLKDPPTTPTASEDALSLTGSLTRTDEQPLMETYEAERLVSENLIQLEEDFQKLGGGTVQPAQRKPDADPVDDSPIYFRRVVFTPDVPIRLDYVGKRVDLSAGPIAGLLMGLGQLNCSELTLKSLDHKLGLLGLEKLVQWALGEWLTDIKRHQLPGLLGGIGPMHSLLQLITGIRDLVWLPVEQWRRDGRLVLGLRRGAASFTARTAVAALDITQHLLQLIQATAETAFDMLTPRPTLQLQDAYSRRERRRRRRRDAARQPADLRQGVASAYLNVKEGFAETAGTLALAARCESGVGVLRHLPGAAVAPLALAAAGAADVLGAVRAHLAPHAARDRADKWRAADEAAE